MKPLDHLVRFFFTFALMTSAHAASINGVINFSSGPTGGVILQDSSGLATTNFASATGVKTWSLAKTDSGNGSFMSIPTGQSVSFDAAPWIFSPSAPNSPLWSIAGSGNFSFTLSSSLVVLHTNTFLAISGTGTLIGDGYEATPAKWFFTTHIQPIDGKYVWSSSTIAIPETGTTTILGAALVGFCLVRRRKMG